MNRKEKDDEIEALKKEFAEFGVRANPFANKPIQVKNAIYAANHVQVDWNEEAVQAAKSYLEMDPMSKSGLIEQLSSSAGEGFTLEQATYAAVEEGRWNRAE